MVNIERDGKLVVDAQSKTLGFADEAAAVDYIQTQIMPAVRKLTRRQQLLTQIAIVPVKAPTVAAARRAAPARGS